MQSIVCLSFSDVCVNNEEEQRFMRFQVYVTTGPLEGSGGPWAKYDLVPNPPLLFKEYVSQFYTSTKLSVL
jgi:hypothetical protein